jgi:hypothetical protein
VPSGPTAEAAAANVRVPSCAMRIMDLVGHARTVAAERSTEPEAHGLMRLSGGMNHDVFAPIDDSVLVAKAFRAGESGAAEREWGALVGLAGTGIAPDPILYNPGDPSIVVMSRVSGSSLSGGALGAEHAWRIGAAHRLVHQVVPWSPEAMSHAGVHAALANLKLNELSLLGGAPGVEGQARRAAKDWIEREDVDELFSSTSLCFSQGDSNLSNFMWTDEALVLVDWEYSGFSDPVLELAGMAEHASTRALGDDFWTVLADATEIPPVDIARLVRARKAMACFWLDLIGTRHREDLPTTVTIEEQADRTLTVLEM